MILELRSCSALIWLACAALLACGEADPGQDAGGNVASAAGSAGKASGGSAGAVGGAAGKGGSGASGSGSAAASGGSAGGGGGGKGGPSGSGGTAANSGFAGSSGGNSGTSGSGGAAANSGTAGSGSGGKGGASGGGGTAANSGFAGSSGGKSGTSGSGGAAANSGTAGSGSGGKSGTSGSGGAAGSAGGPTGGSGAAGAVGGAGVAALLTEAQYEQLFPNRNSLFTYQGLVAAGASFPAFASEGTPTQRLRELAAFFANIGHETTGGWPTAPGGAQAWGLYFKQEVGCEGGACTGYCEPSNVKYPCVPGKTYHGRGPIQLSYNYNYGACGDALGVDLLHEPELVTSSPEVTFRTALWFWMTPQPPKPSAHAVMSGAYQPTATDLAAGRVEGFGLTIDIINGGVECGYPSPPQVKDRVAFFERFCQVLGVDPGPALECATMKPF